MPICAIMAQAVEKAIVAEFLERRGKSLGSIAHWQPVAPMWSSAFTTSRRLVLRGRPICFAAGFYG